MQGDLILNMSESKLNCCCDLSSKVHNGAEDHGHLQMSLITNIAQSILQQTLVLEREQQPVWFHLRCLGSIN